MGTLLQRAQQPQALPWPPCVYHDDTAERSTVRQLLSGSQSRTARGKVKKEVEHFSGYGSKCFPD